jgi:hypothetical protein
VTHGIYKPGILSVVGKVALTDWDDLADALAARGHARGDVYHLPELDGEGDRNPRGRNRQISATVRVPASKNRRTATPDCYSLSPFASRRFSR